MISSVQSLATTALPPLPVAAAQFGGVAAVRPAADRGGQAPQATAAVRAAAADGVTAVAAVAAEQAAASVFKSRAGVSGAAAFLAQRIAQEDLPLGDAPEPSQSKNGLAAYHAAASRGQVVLGLVYPFDITL